MSKSKTEENTLNYHQSGFCCSESILKAVTEEFTPGSCNSIPKIASGFCLGVGKTGEDICGTVVGGVMALGVLSGRSNTDEENTVACNYTAEFRKRFIEKYGTTNCAELLDAFGEQVKMDKCKAMTAASAGIIADILEENHFKPKT